MNKSGVLFILIILSIKLFSQCPNSETVCKSYLHNNSNSLDPIEGIWTEIVTTRKYVDRKLVSEEIDPTVYKYAIIRNGEIFIKCNLNSNNPFTRTFTKTAYPNTYLFNYKSDIEKYTVEAAISSKSQIKYEHEITGKLKRTILSLKMSSIDNIDYLYEHVKLYEVIKLIKLYPIQN